MKRPIALFAVTALCALSTPALAASFLPYGPQNDVKLSTVTNDWGWTLTYQGSASDTVPISSLFSGVGTYVMFAAIQRGSDTIDLLAATTFAEATQLTVLNSTNLYNGARWYYNGYSIGFAGADDTIFQNSADLGDITGFACASSGFNICERDRMSWHASPQNAALAPTDIFFGYRSGNNYLNSQWDRLIFTTNDISSGAVPEPATWAMMLLGFAVIGGAMRARKRPQVRVRFAT